MTDFYDIGLKVDCPEDLVTFAQTHADKADFFSDENGSFGLMKPDEETELWFYGDESGVNPCSMEMYAAGGRDIGVTGCQWADYPEDRCDSGLLSVRLCSGEEEIPLNILTVNAFRFFPQVTETIDGGELTVDFSLFANNVKVYENAADYEENGGRKYAVESLIPCGTFPAGENKNWQPNASVMVTGVIEEAERRENALTGMAYWKAKLRCLGYCFQILLAEDFVTGELQPGNVVSGMFRASGKIVG